MEVSLANPIAVRGTVRTISPVQCPSNLPRGPLGDLFLHHPLSSRPIQSNHLRQSQNHSSMFTEWTAISQRLDHSSVALKPLGRGGVKCKALGKGDQPAPSGQQEVKSEPDKAPEPPQEQNLTDAMSESQYWRQLIDRSLGELSSSKGGVASNKYGGDVGDELGVGQSSGEAKGNVAAPEAIRATKSTPASSYTGPSSKPSPSGDVTPTQYPDSVVGSSALAGSRTPAHISRNRQSLVSGDAERAADSPEPDSQTPRQAGPSPFVEASRSSSEATPQDSAQSKPALNEAATPGPKTAFKRREIDPQKATGPGGGVPGRSRPQGAEPLRPEDWENMSNLLGMSVEELDRNSAGTGLTFEAAAPGPARGREADADVQQEKKLPRGPAIAPPGGRRPQVQQSRRPAPVAVLSRESVAGVRSTSGDKVDRSELTKLRQSLNQKLSEANMYNRHLQRELSARDAAVNESTITLGALQTELKTLVEIAKEIAAGGTRPVTRKINGRYIQSHLAARLEELHGQLAGQVQQVDVVRLRDVPVTWLGVAEDVKLMGSFDGWTQGQHLSPETTGTFTLFSTVLQLRPGRYEVKFVVDGNWQLAPSWPVVGDGLSANNLLVVD